MRRQMTPIACNTGSTAWPIGYCHGFPSPKSPRMLTRVRNGKCPPLIKDSMLTQLPVPLDCISRTPRAPPRSAPASSATPSSSVVNATEWTPGSASERSIRMRWPASGTEVELVPGVGGVFEITVDRRLAFSKKQTARFPTDEEVEAVGGG